MAPREITQRITGFASTTRCGPGGLLAVAASRGVFWGGWAALVPQLKSDSGLTDEQLGSTLFTIPIAAVPSMLLTG